MGIDIFYRKRKLQERMSQMESECLSELSYLSYKNENEGLNYKEQKALHQLLLLKNEGCENE